MRVRSVCTDSSHGRIRVPTCEYHAVMEQVRSCSRGGKMLKRSNVLLDRPNVENLERMNNLSHRFCVAPMMDWTDRHCRFFLRLITRRTRLYTEMITAPALVHGDVPHHLDFDPAEHPLALQLGGSDPAQLAHAAKLGEAWGYDEINLNCGCPSERVQTGSFGACLMAEPALVADCVQAMRDAVALPVTVKHRIGLDRDDRYAVVRDFVGTVAAAGCTTFMVHARNAVLKGLSPKENREVPPLRYDFVHALKRDFPDLTIVLNGGVTDWTTIDRVFGEPPISRSRTDVVHALVRYAEAQMRGGVPLRAITRHVLGLFQGVRGARAWRRMLSDQLRLRSAGP